MSKKRIYVLILTIVAILLIITGIIIKLANDSKIKTDNYNKIINDYEDFKKKAEAFSNNRTYLTEKVFSNLYVEEVKVNNNEWKKLLDNYTKIVNDLDNNSNNLKKLCINKDYKENNIKHKCDAFIIAYETVINYYVKDIEIYNKIIDDYNKLNKDVVSKIDLKYSYIDINNDGKYIGKD